MEPDPIGLHEQYRFKFSEEAEWRKCLDQQGFVVIA